MQSIHSTHTPVPPIPSLPHARSQSNAGGNNTPILRQAQPIANANPGCSSDAQKMIDTIEKLAPESDRVKDALKQYLLSDQLLKDIAREHSCCPATVIYWARKVGLPQRPRGRRKLQMPTNQHIRIINLVRQHGIVETARREGLSKQRTSQIICRWAPELKGTRIRKTVLSPKRKVKRRPPRDIVISFRLSKDEWKWLQAARPASTRRASKLSAAKKARAILLTQLSPSQDEQGVSLGSAGSTTPALVYRPRPALHIKT